MNDLCKKVVLWHDGTNISKGATIHMMFQFFAHFAISLCLNTSKIGLCNNTQLNTLHVSERLEMAFIQLVLVFMSWKSVAV